MDLTTIWFLLIAVLFTGYFILEGFDFGVGMLLPVLGRDDRERRVLINTIGPVWDGNEVWLITAGGAMFAAFPEWYATLFSGFYLPLLLILLALIVRGVAFEYRHKRPEASWKRRWDTAIVVGSLLPAMLWGVAFANILRGVPLDADHEYVGGLLDLLNPYALLGGATTLGAVPHPRRGVPRPEDHRRHPRARPRARGAPGRRRRRARRRVPDLDAEHPLQHGRRRARRRRGPRPARCVSPPPGYAARAGRSPAPPWRSAWPWRPCSPRCSRTCMPSTLDAAGTLTATNAASTPYTLKIMTWVAVIFTPDRAGLPGLDVLGVPQAHRRGQHPAALTERDTPADLAVSVVVMRGMPRMPRPKLQDRVVN